jgi:hypothetical protein
VDFFFRERFFNGREDGRTVLCYKYVYTSPLEGTVDIPSRFTITMPYEETPNDTTDKTPVVDMLEYKGRA